jgi:hypothetical protein
LKVGVQDARLIIAEKELAGEIQKSRNYSRYGRFGPEQRGWHGC